MSWPAGAIKFVFARRHPVLWFHAVCGRLAATVSLWAVFRPCALQPRCIRRPCYSRARSESRGCSYVPPACRHWRYPRELQHQPTRPRTCSTRTTTTPDNYYTCLMGARTCYQPAYRQWHDPHGLQPQPTIPRTCHYQHSYYTDNYYTDTTNYYEYYAPEMETGHRVIGLPGQQFWPGRVGSRFFKDWIRCIDPVMERSADSFIVRQLVFCAEPRTLLTRGRLYRSANVVSAEYNNFCLPSPSHLTPTFRVTPFEFMEKLYGSWN